ncbi:MAG: CDP-alcohol phosphatidyltransferase family protein [Actinomycetota bacterium]
MFDGNWRDTVDKGLTPVGHSLRRAGLTADVITIIGIVMASVAAITIGAGYTRLGFLFLLLTGIPDALDGAVARASGTGSQRGAFFDSVSDRLTDGLLFGGVAWYLASNEPGRIMMLPVAIMGLAMFISYQRAKAESLGYDAKGGIMERAERIIVLALALLFSEYLIPILWVMFALTAVTAIQRFVKVWKQASEDRPLPARRSQRRQPRARRATSESAWRQRMRERRALRDG